MRKIVSKGAKDFVAAAERERKRRGLLVKDWARELGVEPPAYSEWHSRNRSPSPEAVVRFAYITHQDYRDMLKLAGYWPAEIPSDDGNGPKESDPPLPLGLGRKLTRDEQEVLLAYIESVDYPIARRQFEIAIDTLHELRHRPGEAELGGSQRQSHLEGRE
jgi:transcriptional regulator with XRE-family HTH domain